MAYNLQFQVEGELLRVEIWGDRTDGDLVENAKAAWRKVAMVCSENNLSRILVVSNATGRYPTLDGYQINSTLQECGIQRLWRIAFVNLDQDSYEDIEFGETVAVNLGFKVRVFSTEDEARAWL